MRHFLQPHMSQCWKRLSSSSASVVSHVLSPLGVTMWFLQKYQNYLPHSPSDDSAPPSPPFPSVFGSLFPHSSGVPAAESGGQHLPWRKRSQWEASLSCHSCRVSRAEWEFTVVLTAGFHRPMMKTNYGSEVFLPVFVLFG